MNSRDLRARRPEAQYHRAREARSTLIVVVATVAALGGIFLAGAVRERSTGASPSVAAAPPATTVAAAAPVAAFATPTPSVDLDEPVAEDCTITAEKLSVGDTGVDVKCLQQGLARAGYFSGEVTGTYGQETYDAVETAAGGSQAVRRRRRRPRDGDLRRRVARRAVVRHPHAGAARWRHRLVGSSAVVGGLDGRRRARRFRPNSGSGRRVVYERRGQRAWAIDDDGTVIRSWLVSGSKYGNEQPGFHKVYSRSERSTAWNGQAWLPLMIRYQETHIGHIGFHAIPLHVSDGSAYMTEAELGTRLSGGCQRQANADAAFMWDFAQVGTTVVVL